jgi:NTE family protein
MDLGPDRKFLVLQGGGALGAYQAGAYEALHKAGVRPEWIAGISIGAINSAIIAGNPEEKRVERLREFWDMVSSGPKSMPFSADAMARKWFNDYSSASNTMFGVNGFYIPRAVMPWQYFTDREAATSFYDTTPLIATLERLVDFEHLKRRHVRLSVGAVNVANGNFRYFDNANHDVLTPHHIAASGALPPGFPAVEIDGNYYWDGGLVSNTPLQWVVDERREAEDICVFQVDLFSSAGHMPADMNDVFAREKEIRFSSRTRLNTDIARKKEKTGKALKRLLSKLPPEMLDDPDVRYLMKQDGRGAVTVVHLIYRRQSYETYKMDNEFSRLTMEEHWKAGYDDVCETFATKEWTGRRIPDEGFVTIDHDRPEV